MNNWKENQKLLDFATDLGVAISSQESIYTQENKERITEIKEVFNDVSKIINGKNVKITMELHKPFRNSGSISIKGKEIHIYDTKLFVECAKKSEVLNIWSDISQNANVDLSFKGLMI